MKSLIGFIAIAAILIAGFWIIGHEGAKQPISAAIVSKLIPSPQPEMKAAQKEDMEVLRMYCPEVDLREVLDTTCQPGRDSGCGFMCNGEWVKEY